MKLKKDFEELNELDNKVTLKLNNIKTLHDNINNVKALKNDIYEKASKTFIYNLKKLIQLESTQKTLARKIGISEDLLSKYKSGEAFPSIETLVYICEVYNLKLDELINIPLSSIDIENLEITKETEHNIFDKKYYVYFFVTNIAMEGALHEGVIEFRNTSVKFTILSNGSIVKCFNGKYNISDKLIFFSLQNSKDGTVFINMLKPNVNKNNFVGGLALMMLPSDANSKPCVQKIIFSKIKLDRELHYGRLKDLLNFNTDGIPVGNLKLSQWEDEQAYNFIQKLL